MKIPENTRSTRQLNSCEQEKTNQFCAGLTRTSPVRACPGMTQENYVNPLSLGMVMATSIAAMSFAGAWV